MRRPDLHLHTTASDGIFSPAQLVQRLQRADVTLFSITDHDTMSGLEAAEEAALLRGLAFLPGVEISTEGEAEVHILGYGVARDDAVLLSFFEQMAKDRIGRILAMGDKLKRMGFSLDLERIMASAGGSIGRPHLARALVAGGYVKTVSEAFDRYLGDGKPAYVPREKMAASYAISLLKSRGAVPVLAHPGLIQWPMERILPLLKAWQEAGLMGLEVYHPSNRGDYAKWDRLARQQGLLVTGGSDFHDEDPRHGQLGETVQAWESACEDAWALYRIAHR